MEREKPGCFEYEGIVFEGAFRVDLLIDGCVVGRDARSSPPQALLTYLRLMNLPVGLLINFGGATLKEGLHRIVNHLSPSASPRLRVNRSA